MLCFEGRGDLSLLQTIHDLNLVDHLKAFRTREVQSVAIITFDALMTAYTAFPFESIRLLADFLVIIETISTPPGS